MLAILIMLVLAQAASSPTNTPAPTPTPRASPTPVISVAPEFTIYGFRTNGVPNTQADVSNALLNFTVNAGNLHANATVGAYELPNNWVPARPEQ